MKIIHCADVHLGSKMDAKLPREKAEERRRELRASFAAVAEYAKREGVKAILLAGDVFDSDRPLKKDKEFFYSVVQSYPQIDFLYLRGNHDGLQSYTLPLENLKLFGSEWTSYHYGDICVAGIEMTGANCVSLYSSLHLESGAKNIVMLHGQAGDRSGKDLVNLLKLREKNIDYLALGHVHSFGGVQKLDDRGVYAYSGCPEGRGFDETGEKGFLLLDTEDKIKARFIPFSKRTVHIAEADVSRAEDGYGAYLTAKNALNFKKEDMIRVVLTGEVDFDNSDIEIETQKRLEREGYYYIEVRDRTVRKYDFKDLDGDKSLKGEFLRLVSGDNELSEEDKNLIIAAGLKALDGRGEEL